MLGTRELTTGERLLIQRRRAGQNQTEAAKAHGLSEWQYRQCEDDNSNRLDPPALGRLQENEACVILRRRAGMRRTELATKLGVSGWWLTQMERGQANPDRLIAFWS